MAKRWCFTLNNYTDEEFRELLNHDSFEYVIIGKEVSPTTNTPHLQGFAYLKKPSQLSALKKIQPRAHWEQVKGSVEDNLTYCKKDGNFSERGTLPRGQGTRTDLLQVVEDMRGGKRLNSIAQDHPIPYIKYHRGLEKLQSVYDGQKRGIREITVFFLYGESGTGKSRFVFENETSLYPVPANSTWFDGYDGQEAVLFDDFRGGFPFHALLRVIDRYPVQVQVKGNHVWFTPKRIYFTSTKSLLDWYEVKEDLFQLTRRFHEIWYFGEGEHFAWKDKSLYKRRRFILTGDEQRRLVDVDGFFMDLVRGRIRRGNHVTVTTDEENEKRSDSRGSKEEETDSD